MTKSTPFECTICRVCYYYTDRALRSPKQDNPVLGFQKGCAIVETFLKAFRALWPVMLAEIIDAFQERDQATQKELDAVEAKLMGEINALKA